MARRRYGVKVTRRRRHRGPDEHLIAVRTTLGQLRSVDGSPVVLIDSAQFDPSGLDHDGFDAPTRAAHGDARDKNRAEKGRVIYVTAGGAVVGFIAMHVPPAGPFIIERLAIDARHAQHAPDTAAEVQAALIDVVVEASEQAGRAAGVAAWATDVETSARVIETSFGFERARKPKGTDCRLAYYLERDLGEG